MSRTLTYYQRKRDAGLCVNCSKPNDARGVLCKKCSARNWTAWTPGHRGRPPLAAKFKPCAICEAPHHSKDPNCRRCRGWVKRLKTRKDIPQLRRALTFI